MDEVALADRRTPMMNPVLKAFAVSFSIYLISVPGFSYLAKVFPSFRAAGSGFFIYAGRLLILITSVFIFYTHKFSTVFSFLGMKRLSIKTLLAGLTPSLPFILSWIGGSIALDVPVRFSVSSVLMLFLGFIGPGLYEEGLFRGLLFKEILHTCKWQLAALYTGIFFGPAHLANLLVGHNIREIIISTAAGFVMSFPIGYIFFKMRGNLWPCVFFHFFVAGSMDALISEELIKAQLGAISVVATTGLVLSLILVFILFKNKRFVGFLLS